MFRKLVSNLPFSPALVGQLGFYARRLRKEEVTRRLGVVLTVFALIAQSFAVFIPPTPANAANDSDLIRGGVKSVTELMEHHSKNTNNIRDLFDSLGITRTEISKMTTKTVTSNDGLYTWGLTPHYSYAQGERTYTAGGRTFYHRSLKLWDRAHNVPVSTYTAFVGHSAKMGWFGINKNCANLLLKTQPVTPAAPVKVTVCRPGVGVISIQESEKKSTDLPANSIECVPKSAVCRYINVNKIDRTRMTVTAYPATQGNVKITSYVFTVRKGSASGPVVASQTLSSGAAAATSQQFTLNEAATYYVSTVINTTVGATAVSNDCVKTFTVAPPEKCETNPSLPKNDPECKPCPGNPSLWYKSPECNEVIVESKAASNITQGKDATAVTATAGDRIEYKLTISNPGKVPAQAEFKEDLKDVLEYASLQEMGGGTFDAEAKTLTWPKITLAAGESQTRTFVVTLPQQIPTVSQGVSNPTSYDCVMSNTFGNNVEIKVQCDAPKIVEQTVKTLPSTGPGENILFGGVLLAVVSFFWTRSRQLGKEVRLVRKEFSAGAI